MRDLHSEVITEKIPMECENILAQLRITSIFLIQLIVFDDTFMCLILLMESE
jgi:hypothetical protein